MLCHQLCVTRVGANDYIFIVVQAFVFHLYRRQEEIGNSVSIPRYGNRPEDRIFSGDANSVVCYRIRKDASPIKHALCKPCSKDAAEAASDYRDVLVLKQLE